MVPGGKIPLASLWKAAGTLILEQGAAKLGVFDFFEEHHWFIN
jgi:tyrosine-specific transport protein